MNRLHVRRSVGVLRSPCGLIFHSSLLDVHHASQIATTDSTAKRQPITRKKLATEVSKSVKKFIAVRLSWDIASIM
ncbi:hypothetical protein BDM02DRAFT_3112720, partial [Thelephora ganbajun]